MLTLRVYQQRVVDSVGGQNAIIKMPTGSGKTFVAAELIQQRLSKSDREEPTNGKKALFLVPSVRLVEQQADAIQSWCGDRYAVGQYHGNKGAPSYDSFRILVSTPEAFRLLQASRSEFGDLNWGSFAICVFDEVHHVLGKHPYRRLAQGIKSWSELNSETHDPPQIVGVSASLGYPVDQTGLQNVLKELSADLSIQILITPTVEELIEGGYQPQQDNIEVETDGWGLPEGISLASHRSPHAMHECFMRRIRHGTATPFALNLWAAIMVIEEKASEMLYTRGARFTSPLSEPKLASWEKYADQLQCEHGKFDNRMNTFFQHLEVWYVALRFLVTTWEEEEQLVMKWLIQQKAFGVKQFLVVPTRVNELESLASNDMNFTKVAGLCKHLLEKRQRFGDGFRCIVFVQQRISAFVVANLINADPLMQPHNMKAGFVTSVGSPISPSIKTTRANINERVEGFRDGTINILVATSVVEEGFDVQDANCVICYNHIKDTVELCQRFGRARSHDRSIVILEERNDRRVGMLQTASSFQDQLIQAFDLASNENPGHTTTQQSTGGALVPTLVGAGSNEVAEQERQHHLERTAANKFFATPRCQLNPLAVLNEYCQKTKADLQWTESPQSDGIFNVTAIYRSVARNIHSEGTGVGKKAARAQASRILIDQLSAHLE